MKPPLFWRVVNSIRAWCERDDRLLVEQWRSAYGPVSKSVGPKYLNLRLVRGARKSQAA